MQTNGLKILAGFIFIILYALCALIMVPHIQNDLKTRTTSAINHNDIKINVHGRDIKLSGLVLTSIEKESVIKNARIFGVRHLMDSLTIKTPEKKINNHIILHFSTKAYDITNKDSTILKQISDYLLEHPKNHIEIHGHTDDSGLPESNLALSQKRALEVKNYFLENGVEDEQLQEYHHGQEEPLVDNTNETNRARNRRVEIFIKE